MGYVVTMSGRSSFISICKMCKSCINTVLINYKPLIQLQYISNNFWVCHIGEKLLIFHSVFY